MYKDTPIYKDPLYIGMPLYIRIPLYRRIPQYIRLSLYIGIPTRSTANANPVRACFCCYRAFNRIHMLFSLHNLAFRTLANSFFFHGNDHLLWSWKQRSWMLFRAACLRHHLQWSGTHSSYMTYAFIHIYV